MTSQNLSRRRRRDVRFETEATAQMYGYFHSFSLQRKQTNNWHEEGPGVEYSLPNTFIQNVAEKRTITKTIQIRFALFSAAPSTTQAGRTMKCYIQ
jgi:hypothetical protein